MADRPFGFPCASHFEQAHKPIVKLDVPASQAMCQHLARKLVDTGTCSTPPVPRRDPESPLRYNTPSAGGGGGGLPAGDYTAVLNLANVLPANDDEGVSILVGDTPDDGGERVFGTPPEWFFPSFEYPHILTFDTATINNDVPDFGAEVFSGPTRSNFRDRAPFYFTVVTPGVLQTAQLRLGVFPGTTGTVFIDIYDELIPAGLEGSGGGPSGAPILTSASRAVTTFPSIGFEGAEIFTF